jgi:hypothetical protein
VTRCSFCGGQFGLIRHRHFTMQFCKATCKEQHLQHLIRRARSAVGQKLGLYGRLPQRWLGSTGPA